MTTQSWSSRLRHDSDVAFREWGLELHDKLAAAGLAQAADTGQINWTTVTRATANQVAGYEIWYLNDSLHSVAPVYFRIEYASHSTNTSPRINIGVGTGSNGAGTLTGAASTTMRAIQANATQTNDTARQTFLCVTDGFFGLNWKVGASNAEGAFFFSRTIDPSTGLPSPAGALVVWGSGNVSGINSATQALRFASPPAALTAQAGSQVNTAFAFNYQAAVSTALPNGNNQAFVGWTITPAVTPLIGLCGVVNGEIAAGSTFSFAPIGDVAHTFIVLGAAAGNAGPTNVTSTAGLAIGMLWE